MTTADRVNRLLAALLVCASSASAQTGSIHGTIVARGTGEPLPYSIVALPALGREQFSNDSGSFSFGDVPAGPVALRIRRLGYAPSDITLHVQLGASDTIRVELARIAVHLSSVEVRANPPCLEPGPPRADSDSTLAIVFTQIRMNADQYRLLAESYPFYYTMETIFSRKLKKNGEVETESKALRRVDGKASWRYRPGGILIKRGGNYYFQIPTLVDFADTRFLENHCFHNAGTEVVNERELMRIDLVAAERIQEPDVNGSIYLDPVSFQVSRTVLRLSRLMKQNKDITEFELTTDFREILPSIPVIAHVWSVQSIDPKARRDYDTAFEQLHLIGFRFTGAKPGEGGGKKTP